MTLAQQSAIEQIQALIERNFTAGVFAVEARAEDGEGTWSEFYCTGPINSCMGLSKRLSNRVEDRAEGWGGFDNEGMEDDEDDEDSEESKA